MLGFGEYYHQDQATMSFKPYKVILEVNESENAQRVSILKIMLGFGECHQDQATQTFKSPHEVLLAVNI